MGKTCSSLVSLACATLIASGCGGKTLDGGSTWSTAGSGGAAPVGGTGTVTGGEGPVPVPVPSTGGTGPIPVAGTGGVSGGSAGSSGAGGSGGAPDAIVAVRPTAGCGLPAPLDLVPQQLVARTIITSGVKDADATGNPGPWTYEREYWVRLPAGYDATRAYPVIFQGPACGGDGTTVYPLPDIADQVIKVGMTPPPNEINHVIGPYGCFDEREGDDSVEFPFDEAVWDLLWAELCFDQNRVFVTGHGSGGGAWANEMGCKYAGDAVHPMRAIGVNACDYHSNVPEYHPTCSNLPMAGMWIHETNDGVALFDHAKEAIKRAMSVNGCTIGTSFDEAMLENYPIGGENSDDTCQKIVGCPDLYPLVVCPLPGVSHGSHDNVANPGLAVFFSSFFAP